MEPAGCSCRRCIFMQFDVERARGCVFFQRHLWHKAGNIQPGRLVKLYTTIAMTHWRARQYEGKIWSKPSVALCELSILPIPSCWIHLDIADQFALSCCHFSPTFGNSKAQLLSQHMNRISLSSYSLYSSLTEWNCEHITPNPPGSLENLMFFFEVWWTNAQKFLVSHILYSNAEAWLQWNLYLQWRWCMIPILTDRKTIF